MSQWVFNTDDIANTCASTPVSTDHGLLLQKLQRVIPNLEFEQVLSRGGWHRIGGIVDDSGSRISHNLRDWLETEAAGDVQKMLIEYADAGYIATRITGKTHYFVAQTGDRAQDFVQLEIEELQEVHDHKLFDADAMIDDIEDLIDPVDSEKLPAESIGAPSYIFRRITSIDDFMQAMAEHQAHKSRDAMDLQRFMQDWDRSSSKENGAFCRHWVIILREYSDAWGETIIQGKPVSTFVQDVALMKLNGVHRGSRLANLIHGFDHDIGYPMAWYFFMLSHREVPHSLAEAIHRDLMGAYDYLPARDLKILKDWSARPYGI